MSSQLQETAVLPTGITFQLPAEKRQNVTKNWTGSCGEDLAPVGSSTRIHSRPARSLVIM